MNSPEAYRYAEFYNVSVDECPNKCHDASGKQLQCGKIVTPCGNAFTCSTNCSNGGVCKDEQCMACPEMSLTTEQHSWECGTLYQQCNNPKGQQTQLIRHIGTRPAPPSALHFCKENKWDCIGQSKWAFLAVGKECGSVTDNCGNDVDLFPCPMTNDVCTSHKCVCTPATFPQDNNCGAEADGCGNSVQFGANQGLCPGATDRCLSHKCCTPKTRADFDAGFQCGKKSDGCGGYVDMSQAPATSFFKVKQTNTPYNHYGGQRGIEIQAATDMTVTSLAHGLMANADKLSGSARVSLWDVESKKELGKVEVGPTSPVKDGYAWEDLLSSASLTKGKKYRIVMSVHRGQKDKYTAHSMYGTTLSNSFHNKFASFKGLVQANNAEVYPVDTYLETGRGVGTVSFKVLENEGCGAGLWTCHANHSCTVKSKTLTGSVTLQWQSDGSVTRNGWKACIEPSQDGLQLQEEEEKLEVDADAGSLLELTDSELGQLSEEEKQHAHEKYEQYRADEAAEVKAAADEEQAAAKFEAELPEEEHKVEGSLLDADELALPDLTQDA